MVGESEWLETVRSIHHCLVSGAPQREVAWSKDGMPLNFGDGLSNFIMKARVEEG